MSTVKTTFIGKNPFASQFKIEEVDIQYDVQPPEIKRLFRASKYEKVFAKMKVNSCITVPYDFRRRIHEALNEWLRRNKKTDVIVRSFGNQPKKGQAQIFMLPKGWKE